MHNTADDKDQATPLAEDNGCGDHCGHDHHHATPHVREGAKIGRNDPCPCGSGKKYKKCCLNAA